MVVDELQPVVNLHHKLVMDDGAIGGLLEFVTEWLYETKLLYNCVDANLSLILGSDR